MEEVEVEREGLKKGIPFPDDQHSGSVANELRAERSDVFIYKW